MILSLFFCINKATSLINFLYKSVLVSYPFLSYIFFILFINFVAKTERATHIAGMLRTKTLKIIQKKANRLIKIVKLERVTQDYR